MLLCACLQVCLCGFPVLVPVCYFFYSPFAWTLKTLIYVPCVHPSTSWPSISPALLCRFCVFCMHVMTEFSSETITFVPPILIPVAQHALRCPLPHSHPINVHPVHSLSSPTHYARHDMLLLVLKYCVMYCILWLRTYFVWVKTSLR